jgi:hypothetical protein
MYSFDIHLNIIMRFSILWSIATTPSERRHVTSRLAQIRTNINNLPLKRPQIMYLGYIQLTATLDWSGRFIVLRFYHYRHLLVAIARLQGNCISTLQEVYSFITKILFFNLMEWGIWMLPQKSGHFPVSQFVSVLSVAPWKNRQKNYNDDINPT